MIVVDLNNYLRAEIPEVSQRVYPKKMPQNCPKPALVYGVIVEAKKAFMDGWCDDTIAKTTLQISVYAEHYGESKLIGKHIEEVLKTFKHKVKSIESREAFEEDTELYVEIIQIKI